MSSVDPNNISQAILRAIDLTNRRDYAAAVTIFDAVYANVPQEQFPHGLSAYGLCMSQVQHKNKKGAELCEKAIALHPPANDDAILRWNTCARILIRNPNLRPRPDEAYEPVLGE